MKIKTRKAAAVSEVLWVFSVSEMSLWGLVKPAQTLLPTHGPVWLHRLEALKGDPEVLNFLNCFVYLEDNIAGSPNTRANFHLCILSDRRWKAMKKSREREKRLQSFHAVQSPELPRGSHGAEWTFSASLCCALPLPLPLPGMLTETATACPSLLSSCGSAGSREASDVSCLCPAALLLALGHLCLMPQSLLKYLILNLSLLKPVGVDFKKKIVFWPRVEARICRENRDLLTIKAKQTKRSSLTFSSSLFTTKEESSYQLKSKFNFRSSHQKFI